MMTRVVFDIGATHLRIARAENGALKDVEKIGTPKDPVQGVAAIHTFLEKHTIRADEAVGGIAGAVKDGVVVRTSYLSKWDGFNFSQALANTCGIPSTKLLNDAEIAGIGEALLGAGKGFRTVAYVTVSTGIGGALIVDGQVVPYAYGHEPGQQVVDYVNMKTLQDIVGGAALTEEFGRPPEQLEHSLVKGHTRALAVGLYNLLRLWSPDILIVGGSLMNDVTGYSLDAVVRELSLLPVSLPVLPPIVHATLGDDVGLYGALAFTNAESA
ncbi:MAG: ROK family protein [Patescibacteria group bacterium]|nr:ROK family protein [Patescibacteria group bacterium]